MPSSYSENCCKKACSDIDISWKREDQLLVDLASLKDHLKERIKQIEIEEAELEAAMRPQTVEDIETLEVRLQGALEELQEMKNKIKSSD